MSSPSSTARLAAGLRARASGHPAADAEALADPIALLLRTGQLHRAREEPQGEPAGPRPLSTGVDALDAALGGGLTRGLLHEIVAPPSAGGSSLLRAAIAAATSAGELCALIDPGDVFDPRGARLAGVDLRRLLWVRPATLQQALRATEIALEARFALVALDLGELAPPQRPAPGSGGGRGSGFPPRLVEHAQRQRPAGHARETTLVRFEEPKQRERVFTSPWARLARRAEQHGGALLVLARTPQAGAFAAATIELQRGQARWEGSPGTPGRLLRAGAALGAVARARRVGPSGPVLLSLAVPDEPAEAAE